MGEIKTIKKNKGVFITFEGPDGSGKTTHVKLLASYLKKKGYPVILTREPGGTTLGEDIRIVLLDPRVKKLSIWSELFLYLACRSQLLEEIVKPALVLKRVVLCDRFADATIAYQGFGRGLSIRLIQQLNRLLTGRFKPDLTILIDIEPEDGLKRGCSRKKNEFGKNKDRLENEKITFHRNVRKGYFYLAKNEPKRFLVIDGEASIEKNHSEIRQKAEEVIKNVMG